MQSCAELIADRQQLQTQLEALRRQLAESRDHSDVTEAESSRLLASLAAAEQTAAQYRQALHLKVVITARIPLNHVQMKIFKNCKT